jgi:hypothetical protein
MIDIGGWSKDCDILYIVICDVHLPILWERF